MKQQSDYGNILRWSVNLTRHKPWYTVDAGIPCNTTTDHGITDHVRKLTGRLTKSHINQWTANLARRKMIKINDSADAPVRVMILYLAYRNA